MEENLKNLEQPNSNNLNSQGKEILQEDDVKSGAELGEVVEQGSKFGKFKDAEALLGAYNNLQSDYTKKCQVLSSLQKQVEEKDLLKSPTPQSNWQEKVKSFYESNPVAKKYEKQIAQIIVEDKDIAFSENPFNTAWEKFAEENLVLPDEIIKDENFLQNYVFSNKQITQKIVNDYFSGLNLGNAPTLITAQKGSKTVLSSVSKPKTIEEAGKLAQDMF